MIGWLAAAYAAEGSVNVVVGGRTTPDAAIEQPTEWEPRLEPMALLAVTGEVEARGESTWVGLDAAAWALAPEADAMLLALGPRGGVHGRVGSAALEAAARYDAQLYPVTVDGTSGRADVIGRVRFGDGALQPELWVEGVDRWYPFEDPWSFRTAEVVAGVTGVRGHWHTKLHASGQINDGAGGWGQQLRGSAEVGYSGRRSALWARLRGIQAFAGDPDLASRSQFTPLGDYSDDADALSDGGFQQLRVDAGASSGVGPWVVGMSVLGRLRAGTDPSRDTYAQTGHLQLDVERPWGGLFATPVDGPWWFVGTAGVSAVGLSSGRGFVDVYAWAGLSYRPGPWGR
jgi:hypothetical protein